VRQPPQELSRAPPRCVAAKTPASSRLASTRPSPTSSPRVSGTARGREKRTPRASGGGAIAACGTPSKDTPPLWARKAEAAPQGARARPPSAQPSASGPFGAGLTWAAGGTGPVYCGSGGSLLENGQLALTAGPGLSGLQAYAAILGVCWDPAEQSASQGVAQVGGPRWPQQGLFRFPETPRVASVPVTAATTRGGRALRCVTADARRPDRPHWPGLSGDAGRRLLALRAGDGHPTPGPALPAQRPTRGLVRSGGEAGPRGPAPHCAVAGRPPDRFRRPPGARRAGGPGGLLPHGRHRHGLRLRPARRRPRRRRAVAGALGRAWRPSRSADWAQATGCRGRRRRTAGAWSRGRRRRPGSWPGRGGGGPRGGPPIPPWPVSLHATVPIHSGRRRARCRWPNLAACPPCRIRRRPPESVRCGSAAAGPPRRRS